MTKKKDNAATDQPNVPVRMLSKPLQLPVRWVSKGGGKQFAYLSGESVIKELNNIFGHDGWESRLVNHKHSVDNHNGSFLVTAVCDIELTLHFSERSIVRHGSAASSHKSDSINGVDRAIHVAYTDSETTAIKRASRTLGSRFGLDLYDKDEKWKEDYYANPDDVKAIKRDLMAKTGRVGDASRIWNEKTFSLGIVNDSQIPRVLLERLRELILDERKKSQSERINDKIKETRQ
jgi:recombination DNA repair RAD52 pathway protein